MSLWSHLKALFTKKNKAKIHSFTYFIPAPPKRQSGYREKQFDKVFFEFINRGYEILSIHTEAISSPTQPGMWVLITARETGEVSLNQGFSFEPSLEEAILEDEKLDLETHNFKVPVDDKNGAAESNNESNDNIDGLYFIKNHKS